MDDLVSASQRDACQAISRVSAALERLGPDDPPASYELLVSVIQGVDAPHAQRSRDVCLVALTALAAGVESASARRTYWDVARIALVDTATAVGRDTLHR